MAPFARAELEQIGRKMACNEYFGASLDDVAGIRVCAGWYMDRQVVEFFQQRIFLRLDGADLGFHVPA